MATDYDFDDADPAELAANGAALFDTLFPDWWEKIALDRLDMGNCLWCVLGQLCGDYVRGLLDPALRPVLASTADQVYYGLTCRGDRDEDFDDLTAAWENLVLGRLGLL